MMSIRCYHRKEEGQNRKRRDLSIKVGKEKAADRGCNGEGRGKPKDAKDDQSQEKPIIVIAVSQCKLLWYHFVGMANQNKL